MHRPLLFLVTGVLLLTTACGTAPDTAVDATVPPGQAAAQPGTGAAPSIEPRATFCQAVGEVYGAKLQPFAAALSRMVTAGAGSDAADDARGEAQKALRSFADEIRSVTATSTIAEARDAGATAADRMAAASGDEKFFAGIRTGKDVEKVLGPTFSDWREPIDEQCS